MELLTLNDRRISYERIFGGRRPFGTIRRTIANWLTHRYLSALTVFLLFTIISVVVSVLIVCLTLRYDFDITCQLTFKRAAEHSIGYNSRPYHVATGDFNEDNHLDIVVANSGTDSIMIFLGHSNGSFSSPMTYSTGPQSHPTSVAVDDMNKDHQLDIIVANYGTNSIGIFLGNANRRFADSIIISLGSSRPLSLATGNFNNDNQRDIAVVTYGTSSLLILLGSRNGSFQIGTIYHMGYDTIPYALAVTDFNSDNLSDVAVVNYGTSMLTVLIQDVDGSFISQQYTTGRGSHPSDVTIGDFNKDQLLDIAVTNSDSNNVGIFLRYGNNSFGTMIEYATGMNSRPRSISIGDLNHDGQLDIVVIDSTNNNVLILKGNGHGHFSIITRHSTGFNSNPTSLVIGDFDNDNKSDIVVTNNGINNILLLTTYDVYPAANQTTYPTGTNSRPSCVTVGNINNHNHFSDIIVANNGSGTISIFMNNGNGTFTSSKELFLGSNSHPSSIIVYDVNYDGHLDIIVVLSSLSEIQILFGDGNGSFSYNDTYLTGQNSYPQSIAIANMNNDSYLDIVVSNYMTGSIGILYGHSNGSFRNITLYPIGNDFYPVSMAVNDLNNDKILDIIVVDDINGLIAIILGYNNESFAIPSIISTNDDRPRALAIGDLNNDHLLDIIYVSTSFSSLGILFGNGDGKFGNINKYSSGEGTWPYDVALGHFNNDTFLDIVVTNAYGFNIDIFFGLKNGSFTTPKTFSTGFSSIPVSVSLSDFNNDNQLDIVVSNYNTNNIGVFLIQYEMNFMSERSYSTGSATHPFSVTTGDFNHDNRLDIIVANPDNDNIELLTNFYQGSFKNRETYSTGFGSYPQFVAVANFNKDNQLDTAVINNRNGTINIFFGLGNATFDIPILHSNDPNSFPTSMAVGDFNHDNWTDIVVTNNGTNNIGIYFGFDYPTFTNDTIYIPGPSSVPLYLAVDDLNNDHQWDIIVANAQTKSISIYLGFGNGTFAEERSFLTGGNSPISLSIADFNRDMQLDIVVLYREENCIGIFIGDGTGYFQNQTIYSTGKSSYPRSLTIADINQDNIVDIIVANRGSNSVGVFIGYANGSFTEQKVYAIPDRSFPAWVVATDLNKDTILDFVTANYAQDNIGIMFGNGNGTFQNMTFLSTGNDSSPYMVAIADLNYDTWMDIVVINVHGQNVGIFFGRSNGTFSTQITYSTGSQSSLYWITIVDLNLDNQLDIIVSDFGNGNSNIGVFYGYDNGKFLPIKTYSTGLYSNPTCVVVRDFNNDQRLDLAITYTNQDSIGILLRNRSEPLAASILYSTGDNSHPKSVAIADLNHDNHEDIVVANSGTNNIGIFIGNRDGIFTPQQTYSTGSNSVPVSIAINNFNNDTHLDIIVANSQTNTIVIFQGYGNGSFTFFTSFFTGIDSIPSSIAVTDLNRDNYLDIVVANYGSNDILIFWGNFVEPKSYSLGYNARPVSVTIADMNEDNLLDIIVANYGTAYVEILLQTC